MPVLNKSDYPKRLIPSIAKLGILKDEYCSNCKLVLWVNPEDALNTITGELDAINTLDYTKLNGQSLNLILCPEHTLSSDCIPEDVKITLLCDPAKKKLLTRTPFESDENLKLIEDFNFELRKEKKMIGFIRSSIESITGDYPRYPKGKGQGKPVNLYKFKIKINLDPTLINVFHCEIQLYGNEGGSENKLSRNVKGKNKDADGNYLLKDFYNAIITTVRNQCINQSLIFEIT